MRRRHRQVASFCALAVAAGLAGGCGSGSDEEGEESADNAVELSGRIEQVGTKFTGFGFVSRIDGVDPSALSETGKGDISEKDARVTFVFDADLTSRAVVGDSFSLATEGTVSFYLDDQPGADLTDPESFAEGEEVASGSLRVTDVVTVYAPDRGIATATGAAELDEADSVRSRWRGGLDRG